jgi:hypothetical protein
LAINLMIVRGMTNAPSPQSPVAQAEVCVREIMRAADSWASEAPSELTPAIRAVCIRLAEMVADQRHYLSPLPEPQETERRNMLESLADRLRSSPVTDGIEQDLEDLADLELRSTGSWAIVPTAQAEWITTAIQYLDGRASKLPDPSRPDPYWADDVVAGIIASVRAVIGVDELQARHAMPPGTNPTSPEET